MVNNVQLIIDHQEKVYRKIDDYTSSTSNSSQWNNGSFNKRENRYSMNDWPSNQGKYLMKKRIEKY